MHMSLALIVALGKCCVTWCYCWRNRCNECTEKVLSFMWQSTYHRVALKLVQTTKEHYCP